MSETSEIQPISLKSIMSFVSSLILEKNPPTFIYNTKRIIKYTVILYLGIGFVAAKTTTKGAYEFSVSRNVS